MPGSIRAAIAITVFLLTRAAVFSSAEQLDPSGIFELNRASVVMVNQVLFFDQKYARYPKYIIEVEKLFETQLLGTNVPIATGTGFFISEEGHIITNFHVVDKKDLDVTKKIVYRSFVKAIDDSIHKLSFTSKQVDRVEEDLWSLLENSQFDYEVRIGDTEVYEPELLKSNEELDIALLKLGSGARFSPVKFPAKPSIKVGETVIAIGYPLPDVMQTLFKDYQASLTTGTISTIRNDKWGLQHTASLNPGNSGGPLFNLKGEVIGVNVARIKDASNIYFSIPISKAMEWLNDSEYKAIVEKIQVE